MVEPVVLAPGKAVLCGEYAVLHGAPAVSVAVDRVVRIRTAGLHSEELESPFIAAARAATFRHLGVELGPLSVDSSALYDAGCKLGLGSSAAVTAGVCGAAFARAGRTLDCLEELFDVAFKAHQEAQGETGSGIDVATAVFGGTIFFQRGEHGVDVRPVELPPSVDLTFVYAGQSASTGALLAKMRALHTDEPARHRACMEDLTEAAHAFVAALDKSDASHLLGAVSAYAAALARLADAARVELFAPAHRTFMALAGQVGGAAKPSGAGGGDLAVAFTVGPKATEQLRATARAHGLALIPLGAPAPGLRLETST